MDDAADGDLVVEAALEGLLDPDASPRLRGVAHDRLSRASRRAAEALRIEGLGIDLSRERAFRQGFRKRRRNRLQDRVGGVVAYGDDFAEEAVGRRRADPDGDDVPGAEVEKPREAQLPALARFRGFDDGPRTEHERLALPDAAVRSPSGNRAPDTQSPGLAL